ncbi:MAG TPA: hypothetical protein VFC04_00715 [Actinomycetota bacterium]|nr:hypothetical protein [Actinomycetota bacterium]
MATRTKPSNRGFWLVVLPMAFAGVVLIALIVLFRPRAGGEAEVRASLRTALAAARTVRERDGSFAGATALRLRQEAPGVLFIDPDEASNNPRVVSVFASASVWAGAARAESGTCYWIRASAEGATTYGTGSDCTGEAARRASRPAWPAPGS